MDASESHKAHRAPQAGPKAKKKKARSKKKRGVDEQPVKGRNPKAFTFSSVVRAKRYQQRNNDRAHRREHRPLADRLGADTPPLLVAVVGPKGVGKSLLVRCIIRHFTKQTIQETTGPITVVSGRKKRITLFECPCEINAMCDVAKIADLVLLLIDAHFGFEMEVFEFLNIIKTHGFPKIIGVLNHLDKFKKMAHVKEAKKTMKHRFWTEICHGAKLFYLSGLMNGKYLKREILNLCRFVSYTKHRPLVWRNTHGCVLADRYEDLTDENITDDNPKADRKICFYGYVRGTAIKPSQRLHLLGVGDFSITSVDVLPDPCPLPIHKKKTKHLNEKDRMLYAPLADVGNVLFDKDATYINLRPTHIRYSKRESIDFKGEEDDEEKKKDDDAARELAEARKRQIPDVLPSEKDLGEEQRMVKELQATRVELDEEIDAEPIQLFAGSNAILDAGEEAEKEENMEMEEEKTTGPAGILERMYTKEEKDADGRVRRKVVFKHEMKEQGHQMDSDADSEGDSEADLEDDDEEEEQDGQEIEDDEEENPWMVNGDVKPSGEEDDDDDFNAFGTQQSENKPSSYPEKDEMERNGEESLEDGEVLGQMSGKWRERIAERAQEMFAEGNKNLMTLVYGEEYKRRVRGLKEKKGKNNNANDEDNTDEDDDSEKSSDEDFF
mmetsp:Transcript_2453/g.3548  ORF Transcript_2453/g.3548 Transcript_2453/m.3548 type:complete len:667 (+) Transcript_2453:49-2049(+)